MEIHTFQSVFVALFLVAYWSYSQKYTIIRFQNGDEGEGRGNIVLFSLSESIFFLMQDCPKILMAHQQKTHRGGGYKNASWLFFWKWSFENTSLVICPFSCHMPEHREALPLVFENLSETDASQKSPLFSVSVPSASALRNRSFLKGQLLVLFFSFPWGMPLCWFLEEEWQRCWYRRPCLLSIYPLVFGREANTLPLTSGRICVQRFQCSRNYLIPPVLPSMHVMGVMVSIFKWELIETSKSSEEGTLRRFRVWSLEENRGVD